MPTNQISDSGLSFSLIQIAPILALWGAACAILIGGTYVWKKSDRMNGNLIVSLIGFSITCSGLFLLEPIIVKKFSTNSILYVQYFYWILPMGFFVLLYNILEAYSYGINKGVLTNLLKETLLRFYTLCIIVLKIFNVINFHTFILLFAFANSDLYSLRLSVFFCLSSLILSLIFFSRYL